MMPRTLAVACCCLFISFPAHSEIYRWIDARGSVHFSDEPPTRLPHQTLNVRAPSTVPMSENLGQSKRVTQTHQEVSDMLSSSDRPRKPGAAAHKKEQQARQCARYQEKLAGIQSRLRAGYKNDRGNSLRQQRRKISNAYSRECILR